MEIVNSIWAEKLEIGKRTHSLVSVQRMAALRIASACDTVCTAAILAIAGTSSVDLLAAKRMEIYNSKSKFCNHEILEII